jgi:putative transposase
LTLGSVDEETDDAQEQVQGGADHRRVEGAPGGAAGGEICRRHGISDATFYTWRSKYGGLEVSDAKRLKALEEENRKLKKLLAEQMLDAATLREMLGKNF